MSQISVNGEHQCTLARGLVETSIDLWYWNKGLQIL